jgi:hypothetical protein
MVAPIKLIDGKFNLETEISYKYIDKSCLKYVSGKLWRVWN